MPAPITVYLCVSPKDTLLRDELLQQLANLQPPDFVFLHENCLPHGLKPQPMQLAECDVIVFVETVDLLRGASRVHDDAITRAIDRAVDSDPPALLVLRVGTYHYEGTLLCGMKGVGGRTGTTPRDDFRSLCVDLARHLDEKKNQLPRRAVEKDFKILEYALICLKGHVEYVSSVAVQNQIDELILRRNTSVHSVPGQLAGGRHRLTSCLSRGEHESVWRAWDAAKADNLGASAGDGSVAVHFLIPDAGLKAEFNAVYARIQLLSSIDDVRVCRVVELLRWEVGRWLYVTSLPDGLSLCEKVHQRKLGSDQVIPLLLNLGEALQLVHDKTLVHGRLDPSTVVIDDEARPYLVSFNVLPWKYGRLGRNGSAYVAPELREPGAEPTISTDIFSLGMLGVFAFFNADIMTPAGIGLDKLIDELKLEGDGTEETQSKTKRILKKATAVSPKDRFTSVGELCQALRDVLRPLVKSFEFRPILGGLFRMGREVVDAIHGRCRPQEAPPQRVTLSPFYMMRYPITRAAYRRIMGQDPSPRDSSDAGREHPESGPVTRVNFFDALRFCNRLSLFDGRDSAYVISGNEIVWKEGTSGFRLPTEAEWEFAARGSTGRLYPWGNDWNPLYVCWNGGNPPETMGGNTHAPEPVGQHPEARSPFHIEDMIGSVWEWCWDLHKPYTNIDGVEKDPRGPKDYYAPPGARKPHERHRSLRGGSWTDQNVVFMSCTSRLGEAESIADPNIGFRVARSMTPEEKNREQELEPNGATAAREEPEVKSAK